MNYEITFLTIVVCAVNFNIAFEQEEALECLNVYIRGLLSLSFYLYFVVTLLRPIEIGHQEQEGQ